MIVAVAADARDAVLVSSCAGVGRERGVGENLAHESGRKSRRRNARYEIGSTSERIGIGDGAIGWHELGRGRS